MKQQAEKPVRVGVYDTVAEIHRVVHDLREAGFTQHELGVICSDKYKEQFMHDLPLKEPAGTHTEQAIVAGGLVGATIGGLVLAATVLATGGAGLLAIGTALIGGGALTGSFSGAMMTRGFQKEFVDYYDQAVQRGKILVAVEVHGPDSAERLARAERILAADGANPLPLDEG
jgi:hypothetical protein